MIGDPWDDATTIPALPCRDIDELRDFWVALGFDVTYRQLRPNPYLALHRGQVDLHYFGLDDLEPQDSYSTCIVLVEDTGPVFEALADGLRARYGRLPLTGFPRITRPRRRANAGGATGFSLVDPAGNWIRVMRRAPAAVDGPSPRTTADDDSARTAYAPRPAGRLARALDDATVQADSHGDPHQALKILAGAMRRADDASDTDRVRGLAYLAELALRAGDTSGARTWLDELDTLAAALDDATRRATADALDQAAELRADLTHS